MRLIGRRAFFAAYRRAYGQLTQPQVDGLDVLLGALETDPGVVDVRHAAYLLATVKHECADTWAPVRERGDDSYLAKYEPATRLGRQLGNTQVGDSLRYPGRGYSQITGRANYLRIGQAIGLGYTLIVNPEIALDPRVAYRILSEGMRRGLFTGRGLGHYIAGPQCDYVQARRIINGLDEAEKIAGYARTIEGALRAALAVQVVT